MHLSRLILNPRDRVARADLVAPYEMHRTIMRAFPDGDRSARVLFRVDTDRRTGVPTLLVQSDCEPDWSFLDERPGYLLPDSPDGFANPAHKPVEPHVATSQVLRFRLRANPTFKRNGKRLAWVREEDQLTWLHRKAQAGGFEVLSAYVVPEGFARDTKSNDDSEHKVSLLAVRFDGTLRVIQPDRFIHTLRSGIGSAKAFGFGLLSVAPP